LFRVLRFERGLKEQYDSVLQVQKRRDDVRRAEIGYRANEGRRNEKIKIVANCPELCHRRTNNIKVER